MAFMRSIALVACLAVAACAGREDPEAPPPDLGDFRLGHNVVVGQTAQMVPPSRSATAEEWEQVFEAEVARRFGRYQGEGLYHLGISVDAYALAIPGIPVVVSPKSVLVFTVTLWDNATRSKLNPEAKQFTVFESISGDTFVGSGLTQTKEEQMQNLSVNATRAIERWLVENQAWFDGDPTTNPPPPAPAN